MNKGHPNHNVSTDDCWLWAGKLSADDYGQMGSGPAHRVVYEALVGEIPKGLEIDHLCEVTRCVNPDHLEAVTHLENMQRRWGKDICKFGHKLTPDNIYYHLKHRKTGRMGRRCMTCAKKVAKIHYYKQKELALAEGIGKKQ